MIQSFIVEEEVLVPERGTLHIVTLQEECMSFYHLKGELVLLDGELYRVKAIERQTHSPPWRAGGKVGLLAVPVEPKDLE